jgi:prophage regulatory protein
VRLLRPKDCAKALGVSPVTLWRWSARGDFPRPFRLGRQAIAWDESEVLAWLETRRVADVQRPRSSEPAA